MQNEPPFELQIDNLKLQVTSHIINDAEVFRLVFSDGRPPLVITETFICSKISRHDFWTSIPRGRQKEAAFFGKKIDEHFKKK
jgi:hypothetical protein